MQRTGCDYEEPSRISQGLVVGLSIAVILMTGWLATTILLSRYTTTSAVGDTGMAGAPVRVENVSPAPDEPRVEAHVNSADFEPSPRDYASSAPTPPRSALPLASFAEPPPAATIAPGYAPFSMATAPPDANDRGLSAKRPLPNSLPQAGEGRAGSSIQATEAIADLLRSPPLPSPPPHVAEAKVGVASVPVPRPRPRLEGEEVQPGPDPSASNWSPFDFLIDRQR